MGNGKRAALALLLLLLCGCGRLPPDEPLEGVGRTPPREPAETAGAAADRTLYGMPVSEGPAFEAVDDGVEAEIDLTSLNAAALYATVGSMNGSPEDHAGKTIRMAGLFSSDETRFGRRYYCSAPDAAGCCLESFEVRPGEEMEYPGDFPPEGTVVTVSGRFGYERVSEYLSYSFIEDARILWLD